MRYRFRAISPAFHCMLSLLGFATPVGASTPYLHFESPPVHPVELSLDRSLLFVTHTADHRLVVVDVDTFKPHRVDDIPVGLEPVSVRARGAAEVWVVNHVSDSISIVDVSSRNVIATLLAGEEPTDVVFAGNPERAFVSVSGEDLVRVFDPNDLGAAPVDIPLEGIEPRSLAVSPDGSVVYVGIFESGNATTIVPPETVTALGGPPPPDPPLGPGLPPPPEVALIVQHDGTQWVDETGGNWDAAVGYTMPDVDVVHIDTSTLSVTAATTAVGTTLFNLAVHPTSGALFVSNQEARNLVRFEPNLKGHLVLSRVTEIGFGNGTKNHHDINPHVDYGVAEGSPAERAQSLSLPLDLEFRSDGSRLFGVAMGSRKVFVMDPTDGELDDSIDVGDGPCGLALDEARERIYVFNRISNTLSIINASLTSYEIPLGFDPTPLEVQRGQSLFYDAENSSAHGESSCASCHLFTDWDGLAWDLGDPQSIFVPPPFPPFLGKHPMKGPMMTQSLRELGGTGPFHWRGDRIALDSFQAGFVNLMGRSGVLPAADFLAIETFLASVIYPPNPHRELDGSLPASIGDADPSNGKSLFEGGNLVGGSSQCSSCHPLPITTNAALNPASFTGDAQDLMSPQLRNMAQKTRFTPDAEESVRGFGFTHDGTAKDIFSFLQLPAFTFASDDDRRDVEAYVLTLEGSAPAAVGAQWTMNGTNENDGLERVQTFEALADADVLGLIARGNDGSNPRGWEYLGSGSWRPDRAAEANATTGTLLALAGAGTEVTFTAVLEGREHRLGIDRDEDGVLDGDEQDAGSDPFDPASTPGPVAVSPQGAGGSSRIWLASSNPSGTPGRFRFHLPQPGPIRLGVYDLRGRLVRNLLSRPFIEAGLHTVSWDLRDDAGKSIAAGTYLIRLRSVGGDRSVRMTVLR